jgi:large-conductance mechanosensitive channel
MSSQLVASSPSPINLFKDFVNYLRERNFLTTAVGLTLTLQATAVINAIVNNFISPLLNRVVANNKTKRFSEYTVDIGNDIKIEVGVFTMVIIRALFVIFFGYFIFKALSPTLATPVKN